MKRKIYNKLLEWKQLDNRRTALLVDGARRVGKSYIVEKFAKNEYKSYLLIDFSNVHSDVIGFFEHYLTDLSELFLRLSLFYRVPLFEHDTLFIFDEVQFYPPARAAIKQLVADGRYDFIETGSLVSINKNVKDILIPSEERRVKMYPMDFEEFLWAMGVDDLMPFVQDCFHKQQPLGQAFHRRALDYFRQYLIVGGMPQAVNEYVSTRDFVKTDRVKRDILDLYRSDIRKYAQGAERKVVQVFNTLPAQLQKHEKKFRLSALKRGARFRDYESAFFWLEESMVVNMCYAATEPSVGLRLKMDEATLKCYMGDTGLLISLAFDEAETTDGNLFRKLMLGKLELNKGMLVENVVAQMLKATGHELYFFSAYSKADSQETMEIDFLVRKRDATSRHNIIPLEVKSTSHYTHSSIDKFNRKYGQYLAPPIILHTGDFKHERGISYLPIYMTPCL